jgi:hypothetical protein
MKMEQPESELRQRQYSPNLESTQQTPGLKFIRNVAPVPALAMKSKPARDGQAIG